MIAANQLKSSLSNHKPPTFSGEVMEYSAFITAFDTLVESKVDDLLELLYYLEQYTAGKAKEIIKGCLQNKSTTSYKEAKALLKRHFGDPFKIANAYITQLLMWTSIKPNDGGKLQEFAIILEQTKAAMSGMEYMSDLNTAHVMRQLWEKLPRYLCSKWCERANSIKITKGHMAKFEEFVEFISKQADLATDPVYSEELVNKEIPVGARREQRNKGLSFATGSKEENENQPKGDVTPCTVCQRKHDLDQCMEFKKLSLAQRKNLLKTNDICFGCYGQGHIAKFCKQKKLCKVCKKQHPTALHDPNWKPPSKLEKEKDLGKAAPENKVSENQVNNSHATICDITDAGDVLINMGIIPVYALLDNTSGGTFIKQETMERLQVKGEDTKLRLTTMHGTKEVETKAVEGLVVEHFQHNHAKVELPTAYVRQQIPADQDEIPRADQLVEWPHLKEIAKRMPRYTENTKVGVLIGLNCPSTL